MSLRATSTTSTTIYRSDMNYYKLTILRGDEQIPVSVIIVANTEEEAIETFKKEQPMVWSNGIFDGVSELPVKNWSRKRKPQIVFE